MNDGSVEDRLLLRERLSFYAEVAFQGDRAAWLANWTEDCAG